VSLKFKRVKKRENQNIKIPNSQITLNSLGSTKLRWTQQTHFLSLSLYKRRSSVMDESLTPNPKQKPASTTTRIQAPTSPFFLGSNDDRLEREQARAARAAASRRRSVIFARGSQPETESDPCFDKQQILELFQNCIKLASENVSNYFLLSFFFPHNYSKWKRKIRG